jgi:thiamine transport system permease protein
MATRLLLQALENIPGEQRQIAAQLGMRGYPFSVWWSGPGYAGKFPRRGTDLYALLRQLRHRAVAGGGPRATTIELAIYQALNFDYDPARAAMLALIQMVCCLGLVLLAQRLSKAVAIGTTKFTAGAIRTIACTVA